MKKRLLALIVMAAFVVGVACTADLNDFNLCYAIAQEYCKKAQACDPGYADSTDGGPNCTTQMYQPCVGVGAYPVPPLEGGSGEPSRPSAAPSNYRDCVGAIEQSQCGQSPGSACPQLPNLPQAPAPSAPKDSGAPDTGTAVDSGSSDGSTDSTVTDTGSASDTGALQDTSGPCVSCGTMIGNTGIGAVTQLAVSGSTLFWASGSTISAVSLNGGPLPALPTQPATIQSLIAAPNGGIAWIESEEAYVLPLNGTQTEVLSSYAGEITSVASESSGAGWIYALTSSGVIAGPLSGGSGTPIYSSPDAVLAGDAAGTFVAWAYEDSIEGAQGGTGQGLSYGNVIQQPQALAVMGEAGGVLILNAGSVTINSEGGSSRAVTGSNYTLIAASGTTGALVGTGGSQITVINSTGSVTSTVQASSVAAIAVGGPSGSSVYWVTNSGELYSYP